MPHEISNLRWYREFPHLAPEFFFSSSSGVFGILLLFESKCYSVSYTHRETPVLILLPAKLVSITLLTNLDTLDIYPPWWIVGMWCGVMVCSIV